MQSPYMYTPLRSPPQFQFPAQKHMAKTLLSPRVFPFLSKIILKKLSAFMPFLIQKPSIPSHQKSSFIQRQNELKNRTLVFHFEGAVLKSPSLFPYFMLVAFEAGGVLRSLLLLILYPLVALLGKEMGLRVMVFICFFGIQKDKFRIGRSVLPKFFLEDVGCEGFDAVMWFEKKIAVTGMPRVMVEAFLREYLQVDSVIGGDIKVFHGYFLGVMEEGKIGKGPETSPLSLHLRDQNVGLFHKSCDQKLLSHCKEVYLVTAGEKSQWTGLPREKYPKPLIFHDGRLAFRPTPSATLVMFMWLPLGLIIHFFRVLSFLTLPYSLSVPLLAMSGVRTTVSKSESFDNALEKRKQQKGGFLFICNHRTLLDPVYISFGLTKSVSAVTYSLSWFSEFIAPIKTVRLTRDRDRDKNIMERMLREDHLVVCPEGTTCREPYLLRFSPLFAEISDEIVPVAIDIQVSMFHGSTATGLKSLDTLFHLSNPHPVGSVKFFDKLPASQTLKAGGKPSCEVANIVQNQIATALGFECTNLTRKDKYRNLAGNEGIV